MKTSAVIAFGVLCSLSPISCSAVPTGQNDYLLFQSEPTAQEHSSIYNVPFLTIPFLNLIQRYQMQKEMPEVLSNPPASRRPLLVRIITAHGSMAASAQNSSAAPQPSTAAPKQDPEPVPASVSALTPTAAPAPAHIILIAPAPKPCSFCGSPSQQCNCKSRALISSGLGSRPYCSCASPAEKRDYESLVIAPEPMYTPSHKICSMCGYPSQQCSCMSRLAVASSPALRSSCSCGSPGQHCVCRRVPHMVQESALHPQCSCGNQPCNCRSRFNLNVE